MNESIENSFIDYDDQFELPHELKMQVNDNEENNFFNATIHCLTNIRSFWALVYNNNDYKDDNQKSFYNFINSISNCIQNKTEKNICETEKEIEKYSKSILSDIYLFKNKSTHDPRLFIDCILNYFLKEKNEKKKENENESKILNLSKDYIDNSCSLYISNLESNNYEPYKYKIILKKTKICKNEKCGKVSEFYKYFSSLHFYLNYNKEKTYTIYDCFKNYLNKKNEEIEYICPICYKNSKIESNISFYYLTNSLIIFIYYGDEKDKNIYQDFYYQFEEIIDFSKTGFVNDNIKNKKYILSSIIVCKHPKDEEELFYTYCRKDYESLFWVYNSFDIRGNFKTIKDKIIKLKDEKLKKNRSFPYVLVYTQFVDNKNN